MRRRRSEKTKQSKKNKDDNPLKCLRLIKNQSQQKDNIEEQQQLSGKRVKFYGCYLLASLCPRFQGHTYIGFTVNPKRRIRQHNGEITSGAFRTKKKRPWEMVLCIHGFPTNVAALQFEWAWQHPRESLAVREAASSFKTLGGIANKIKLALTMLTLHSWQSMDLKVSFFCTKYMKHIAGCPSLPQQMKLHFCSMDELPCYGNTDLSCDFDDEDDIQSNDNRHSSDDRLEPYVGDSMESCNISYSLENSSDETRSSETRSFPMMDSQENGTSSMMDPLKNGSSSMIDQLENGSSSMIDPLENGPSSMIDPLENGSSSMMDPLENGSSSMMDPLENESFSINDPLENGLSLMTAPVANGSSSMMDPLGNRSFSMMDPKENVSVMEDTAKKENITCIVIDAEEYCEPTAKRVSSPFKFVDTFRSYSNDGVEIIELCTPSPEFRVNAGNKKKKIARDFPDIIDLTTSPSFVEL